MEFVCGGVNGGDGMCDASVSQKGRSTNSSTWGTKKFAEIVDWRIWNTHTRTVTYRFVSQIGPHTRLLLTYSTTRAVKLLILVYKLLLCQWFSDCQCKNCMFSIMWPCPLFQIVHLLATSVTLSESRLKQGTSIHASCCRWYQCVERLFCFCPWFWLFVCLCVVTFQSMKQRIRIENHDTTTGHLASHTPLQSAQLVWPLLIVL